MRFSLALGLVAPCCLVAACGSSGPSMGSLNGRSPQEILTLSTAAIAADGSSFHFVDQSRVGTRTTTLIGDDTRAGSDQTLSGTGSALAVVRRADGSVYVRGAAGALVGALGLSKATAAANAGKWIALRPGDAPYSAVVGALNPKQELDSFIPTAPYTLGTARVFHNRTVVGVSGPAPASAVNGTAHVATLYVPTEPPYTPVGATLTFGRGSGQGTEAVVFSNWGGRTNPPAPSPVVDFSTLTG